MKTLLKNLIKDNSLWMYRFEKTILVLLFFVFTSSAQNQLPDLRFEIDLDHISSGTKAQEITKKYQVKPNQFFSIKLLNDSVREVPKTINYVLLHDSAKQVISRDEFNKKKKIDKGETLKLRVEVLEDGRVNKVWELIFSTKAVTSSNPNFAFISAIRTVDGEKTESEFFDVFLKLNSRLLTKVEISNAFTMAGFEFNFSAADSTSSQKLLNEATFSLNRYLMSPKRIRDRAEKINRLAFFGLGSKIFDERVYVGGHFGVLQIGGPMVTTYLFSGYYNDIYADKISDTDVSDGANARQFRHNIYTEFAVSANGSEIPILSDIRFKVGILFPFKGSGDNEDNKPTIDDVKHRIVLEIPVDKIIKFD